jgi:isocitrate/isopropylmalate dehydrogenase
VRSSRLGRRLGEGRELAVVRNLIGGSYGGADDRLLREDGSEAADVLRLTRERVAEVVHIACDVLERRGGGRLVSADKANLYATGRLWRQVAGDVARERGVEVEHRYVDRAAFELGSGAPVPDVLVTEGLLGDILSDLAAGRAGSPALCGSASLHPGEPVRGRCVGLFEPAHGSAPRRALRDQVDPLGGFLALAALLRHFPATRAAGERVRAAVDTVLRAGPWTYDLAPEGTAPAPTGAVAGAVLAAFDALGDAGPTPPVAVNEPDVRVPADVLAAWTTAVLTTVGVRPQHARDVARVLGYADLSGIDSHGVARLPAYVQALRTRVIATEGEPTVAGDGAVALVDGHGLLGHPVTTLALAEAVDRARAHGVGWVNVRGSSHHGASGAYAFQAAEQGLVRAGRHQHRPGRRPDRRRRPPPRHQPARAGDAGGRRGAAGVSTWRPPRSPPASSRSRCGPAARCRWAGGWTRRAGRRPTRPRSSRAGVPCCRWAATASAPATRATGSVCSSSCSPPCSPRARPVRAWAT